MVFYLLGKQTGVLKPERELKEKIQSEEENYHAKVVQMCKVKVLCKISPDQMWKAQVEDTDLSTVVQYLQMHDKVPSYARIKRYLLCFDQLVLIKGTLHLAFRQGEAEYHQLIIPPYHRLDVLKMLHDDQGHQSVKGHYLYSESNFVGALAMWRLITEYKITKGPYVEPIPFQGSLIVNNL